METDIKWDDLTKDQRNILMWPDLLAWNEPVEHVIKRNTPDSKLGLKFHSLEDKSTSTWYHIVSHVEKNNSAAKANIMPYLWITNVGDQDTRNLKHNDLAELFNNKEMTFRVYSKKPDDPLTCFESEWPDDSKSTVVTFKIKKPKEFIEKLNLGHFYSKERNYEEKDRILIWKVGQFSSEESTELLKRGDRLLEVNGKAVESKKLKDIYKMFSKAFPGEVDAKIIKIRHGISSNETKIDKTTDAYTGNEECNKNNFVKPVKETNGHDGQVRNEQQFDGSEKVFATSDQEEEKQNNYDKEKSKIFINMESKSNEGYTNTPKSERKSPKGLFACGNLDSNSQLVINETTTSKTETNNGIALPYKVEPEKQIKKYREYLEVCDMDYTTANKIFTLLDHNDMNAEDLVSAFDYFSFFDGAQLKKKREPYGGMGLAEVVIKRWANDPASNHTVNDLKQIIKTRLKRKDVLTVIKNWEMKFPAEHVEKASEDEKSLLHLSDNNV